MNAPIPAPDEGLAAARENAALGLAVPAGERRALFKRLVGRAVGPFLRRQVTVNQALLDEAARAAARSEELRREIAEQERRLTELSFRLDEVSLPGPRLEAVEGAIASVGRTVEGLDHLVRKLGDVRDEIQQTLVSYFETMSHHHEVLVRHDEVLARHEEQFGSQLLEIRDEIRDEMRHEHPLLVERIEFAALQAFSRHHEGVGSLQAQLADVATYVDDIARGLRNELTRTDERRRADLDDRVAMLEANLSEEIRTVRQASGSQFETVRAATMRQLARLTESVTESRLRLASLDLALDSLGTERGAMTGAATAQLESPFERIYDRFSAALGVSSDWREARGELYLGLLADVAALGPVVDAGAGDGWWLRVLHDAGVPAYGLEIRVALVDEAREAGLDVRLQRVEEHLSSCPKGSVGAITMLNLIEYLEVDQVVNLLDMALLALHPGGVLIIETVDPANLVVASRTLPEDPLRRRLYPAGLLDYLVGVRGFGRASVHRVDQSDAPLRMPDPQEGPWVPDLVRLVEVLNEYLFSPATYTLTARR